MIDEIIKNKKTIINGLFLIVLFLLITYFINNKDIFNKNYNYSEYEEIKKYDANKYIPVYIKEKDIVNKYLNDYKNLILNNREKAYELLNENYRNKKFGNYDKFNKYMDTLVSISFYNANIDKYDVIKSNGYKFFDIYDMEGNRFIIKELSINNFEVFLDGYSVEIK